MTKRTFWLTIAGIGVLLIVLSIMRGNFDLGSPASASETPEAAQRELPQLIKIIQRDAVGFGFRNAQEVEAITLGRPHRIYQPQFQNVEQYRPDMQFTDLFIPTNSWQFPVLLNGQAKGLTLLKEQDGRFQFIGFGAYTELAQNLADFQAQRDRVGATDPVDVVPLGPLYTNFALVDKQGNPDLTLLSHVPAGKERSYLKDVDPGRAYKVKDIMPKIVRDLAKAKNVLPRK